MARWWSGVVAALGGGREDSSSLDAYAKRLDTLSEAIAGAQDRLASLESDARWFGRVIGYGGFVSVALAGIIAGREFQAAARGQPLSWTSVWPTFFPVVALLVVWAAAVVAHRVAFSVLTSAAKKRIARLQEEKDAQTGSIVKATAFEQVLQIPLRHKPDSVYAMLRRHGTELTDVIEKHLRREPQDPQAGFFGKLTDRIDKFMALEHMKMQLEHLQVENSALRRQIHIMGQEREYLVSELCVSLDLSRHQAEERVHRQMGLVSHEGGRGDAEDATSVLSLGFRPAPASVQSVRPVRARSIVKHASAATAAMSEAPVSVARGGPVAVPTRSVAGQPPRPQRSLSRKVAGLAGGVTAAPSQACELEGRPSISEAERRKGETRVMEGTEDRTETWASACADGTAQGATCQDDDMLSVGSERSPSP